MSLLPLQASSRDAATGIPQSSHRLKGHSTRFLQGLQTRDNDSGDGEIQSGLCERARKVAARWFASGPPAFRGGLPSEPVAPEGDH